MDKLNFQLEVLGESLMFRHMTKIGRNEPCPCGSGKKYKRCHGGANAQAISARGLPRGFEVDFERQLREKEAERIQREKQQGLGRGIVSMESHGYRIVAVGNAIHYSKGWRSFHDFLSHFLIGKLGPDWFLEEQAKPAMKRHPIVRWYLQGVADAERLGTKVGDLITNPMTGAQRAFLNLAYNIYIIAHHAEPREVGALLETFLARLKSERSDDFTGKLFETYAAAAFLKAGFKVAYEDESNKDISHVEFVATFPRTGKRFSVEVKSRNRAATEDGAIDDVKRLRIASKLNRALAKKAEHTRVVMIEVNVPDVLTSGSLEGWPRAALDQIRQAETVSPPDGSEKPSAYVLVTNHAFHSNLDQVGVGAQVLAAACRIPDFGPDVPYSRLKDLLDSEMRHQEMFALLDSVREHYEIPSTFDGQNPELVFRPDDGVPQLKIGQWYMVPSDDGHEVAGQLVDAVVDEHKATVTGIYQTGSDNIMVAQPLTERELAAWKLHPDTFFGEVREPTHTVGNWLEMARLMFETYKNTSRSTLLTWMKGAPDIDELNKLSQLDLAVTYCERISLAIDRNKPTTS